MTLKQVKFLTNLSKFHYLVVMVIKYGMRLMVYLLMTFCSLSNRGISQSPRELNETLPHDGGRAGNRGNLIFMPESSKSWMTGLRTRGSWCMKEERCRVRTARSYLDTLAETSEAREQISLNSSILRNGNCMLYSLESI